MANWTGTITFTAPNLHSGTAVSGNTTVLSDSGNTFKTAGSGLSNYTLRMLTGTSANINQERLISSNTATSITVSPAFPSAISAGDTYEIILKFQNNDHVTGNLVLDTGTIWEIADSATVLFDGLYYIQCVNGMTSRVAKSKSTMPLLKPSTNASIGFWNYVYFMSTCTNEPVFNWVKMTECAFGGVICNFDSPFDMSKLHHTWVKNFNNAFSYAGAMATNISTTKKFPTFFLGQRGVGLTNQATNQWATGTNSGRWEYNNNWVEDVAPGTSQYFDFSYINGADRRFIRTVVFNKNIFKNSWYEGLSRHNSDAAARVYMLDNYVNMRNSQTPSFLYWHSAITPTGISYLQGNQVRVVGLHGPSDYHSTVTGSFNDCIGNEINQKAYNGLASQPDKTGDVTSDRDYFAGYTGAPIDHADVSNATSSTETPQQYLNFNQVRTNARSTMNKALTLDNIATSGLSFNTVNITFDCKNGDDLTSSTVNSNSASGQTVLNVSSTTGFIPEETIEIGFGTARFETGIIDSIGAGTLTLKSNLTFTHTSGQADTVKKAMRQIAIAGVMWGTSSGIYTNQTYLPNESSFGALYCGFTPEITRDDGYSFKQTSHSITLNKLDASTTYYYRPIALNPFNELMIGAESSFTTTVYAAGYPSQPDVRSGTAYGFGTYTGSLDLPATSNVRSGITYDSTTKTGLLDLPSINDVRSGTQFDQTTKTGLLDLPATSNVHIGTQFDQTTKTGTYDGSDRWTDPGITAVLGGIQYKANSTTNNRTGTLAVPTTSQIATAVWDTTTSGHTTVGTFGLLIQKLLTVGKFLGLK